MTKQSQSNAGSKWSQLIPRLLNDRFRHAYFEKTLKAYLANQIRAIRGDETQKDFGRRIGMTQSVISRLEDENYGKVNAQTLIDMAKKLGLALVIKFVDYPTFLLLTDDFSASALQPAPFEESQLTELTQFADESATPLIAPLPESPTSGGLDYTRYKQLPQPRITSTRKPVLAST